MIYAVSYKRNNTSHEVLVDAPGAKAAERYLLSRIPSARIAGVSPARAAELKHDVPLLTLSPTEEKVLRDRFMMAGLDDLDLSVRSYNGLRRSGINTVGELVSLTEGQLSEVRNLGMKCQDEIISVLEEHGEYLSPVQVKSLKDFQANGTRMARKPSLNARIASVAHYTENEAIKEAVLRSEKLRNKTLDICYEIPGYTLLPRKEANALYDLVKKAVSLSIEKERMAAEGIGER